MEPFFPIDPPPRIAVLDYGMGNLRSVVNAFRFVGAEVVLAESSDELDGAEALVFPGQGAIVDCMRRLRETGLDGVIREWVAADRPFYGICLGLQALFEFSEEGETEGLSIFEGRVRRFQLPPELKIPHMGWNAVRFRPGFGLVEELSADTEAFYFVHSYYVDPVEKDLLWCEADYGGWFCAGISKGNCFASQFHPEKSQRGGLQLYRNFLELTRQHNRAL